MSLMDFRFPFESPPLRYPANLPANLPTDPPPAQSAISDPHRRL